MSARLLTILFLAQGMLPAQEQPAAPPQSPPPPEPLVLSNRTKRIEREEPAPLPDMKPIRRIVTATIQRVEPVPSPEPPAAAPSPDPEALARFREMLANLDKRTLEKLGLTKEQGKRAIEGLKKDCGLQNDAHNKIMKNGDVLDSHTGEVFGNLYDYVP